MTVLRRDQLETLTEDYRLRRRERIWRDLCAQYPHLVPVGTPDDSALRVIDDAVEDGKVLGITRHPDLLSFAALYFLPEQFRQDPLIAGVLMRTLNRVEWAPEKRLEFLHRHVVVRVQGG